jgi:putative membrane protein insertion efficiency factor
MLGPRCRFYPTCSEYAIEAIQKKGIFKGFFLAVWRILRCNPLSAGGYDPVK